MGLSPLVTGPRSTDGSNISVRYRGSFGTSVPYRSRRYVFSKVDDMDENGPGLMVRAMAQVIMALEDVPNDLWRSSPSPILLCMLSRRYDSP